MKSSEKEFGKKTSVAFVAQIVGQIVNMLFVVIVGRLLGADIYGEVLFVFTILNFCMALTKFGLVNSLVAFIARGNITIEQKRWIVQRALFISSGLSIFCIVVLFMGRSCVHFLSGDTVLTDGLFVAMLPFILCQTVIEVTSAVIRGSKDIKRHYIGSIVLGNFLRMVGVTIVFLVFNIRIVFCLVLTY